MDAIRNKLATRLGHEPTPAEMQAEVARLVSKFSPATPPQSTPTPSPIAYKGETITRSPDGLAYWNGRTFASTHAARCAINRARPYPPRTYGLPYFLAQTLKTRLYGSTYLHKGAPMEFSYGGITFTARGYGRSLNHGGHKWKIYAHRDGKTVPTKELQAMTKAQSTPTNP